MTDIILVHGAWHNEHCWAEFVPLLAEAGLHPHVLTLPGHVEKQTVRPDHAFRITMGRYADAVIALAEKVQGPAVLLGHSMGGYVISAAANKRPDLFSELIYVTAMVPKQVGTPLFFAHMTDLALPLMSWSVLNPFDGTSHFKPHRAGAVLYNRCSAQQVEMAVHELCPQPIRPLLSSTAWQADRLGSVRKSYIECTDDRTLPIDLQRKWQGWMDFAQVETIDADHSPFLSAKADLLKAVQTIIQD